MHWTQLPLGPIQTNAYVLENNDKAAIIFDPGGDAASLISWLTERNIKPLAILLTHAHFDHIGAVDEVRDHYDIPVYVHELEKDWLGDPEKNGSGKLLANMHITTRPADHYVKEEGTLSIGGFSFTVYETPGHSPGSVSFYHKESETVFSGDVLFSGGVGRTDLLGGDMDTLLSSIHNKILELPEETQVASGHGPVTTVANEMNANPFLNGLS
ncbi:MBL fold metallo-hydrolase [Salsuginibacillus kocurii]|uniref:MBL fold metallo-hydrolase n=1 Tax=Salsuginibacillus kocurii TaxID=427078 RepID=UPI00037EC8AC|nr:MBL fold metallo-hydrolase [Salsuginibacillus kocurii]